MEPKTLQGIWPVGGPWTLQPVAHGENNLTWRVESPAGTFVLRAYRGGRPEAHVRYELAVLDALDSRDLPFQIPVPIATEAGDLLAEVSGDLLTLAPWLPGSPPHGHDLALADACGRALAELVAALAQIRIEADPHAAPFPMSDDLQGWAGAAIDPAQIFRGLPLTTEEQAQATELLEDARRAAPALYRDLPRQIIHRDFDQSNVLTDGGAVTGVLDFEFCGPDLRVLELAYALSKWPGGLWNSGKEWPVLEAFTRGFVQRERLRADELDALPAVLRVRAAASLYYRCGRAARGLESRDEMLDRVRGALADEAWLRANPGVLTGRLQTLLKQAGS